MDPNLQADQAPQYIEIDGQRIPIDQTLSIFLDFLDLLDFLNFSTTATQST
jgi:hypothetical protein